MKRTAVLIASLLALAACSSGSDYHPISQIRASYNDAQVCDRFDEVIAMLNDADITPMDQLISTANAFAYAAGEADDAELGQAATTIAMVTATYIYGTEAESLTVSGDAENGAAYSTLLDICDSIGHPIRTLDEGAQ